MSKYMLITVCEREISTEQFDNFEDARNQMMEELKEQFFGFGHNYDEDDEEYQEWLEISSNERYEDTEFYQFAFDSDSAWSNIDDDYKHDWQIVEIQ